MDFQKLILKKKNVLIRTREREMQIKRERDRCVKWCALGKEEGVRAKTKRVKMASEKRVLLKRLILGESQFCQFTDKCQKRAKAHACQIEVQDMIQSFLERESKRDSYSQPDTMTLKNKGKTTEFWMKRAKGVFEMKGFE